MGNGHSRERAKDALTVVTGPRYHGPPLQMPQGPQVTEGYMQQLGLNNRVADGTMKHQQGPSFAHGGTQYFKQNGRSGHRTSTTHHVPTQDYTQATVDAQYNGNRDQSGNMAYNPAYDDSRVPVGTMAYNPAQDGTRGTFDGPPHGAPHGHMHTLPQRLAGKAERLTGHRPGLHHQRTHSDGQHLGAAPAPTPASWARNSAPAVGRTVQTPSSTGDATPVQVQPPVHGGPTYVNGVLPRTAQIHGVQRSPNNGSAQRGLSGNADSSDLRSKHAAESYLHREEVQLDKRLSSNNSLPSGHHTHPSYYTAPNHPPTQYPHYTPSQQQYTTTQHYHPTQYQDGHFVQQANRQPPMSYSSSNRPLVEGQALSFTQFLHEHGGQAPLDGRMGGQTAGGRRGLLGWAQGVVIGGFSTPYHAGRRLVGSTKRVMGWTSSPSSQTSTATSGQPVQKRNRVAGALDWLITLLMAPYRAIRSLLLAVLHNVQGILTDARQSFLAGMQANEEFMLRHAALAKQLQTSVGRGAVQTVGFGRKA